MKDLEKFIPLQESVSAFVAPIAKIKVTSFAESDVAVAHGKKIKELLDQIEAQRDALVRPRNTEVKLINERAREVRSPLEDAKAHLEREVGAFAQEQRRIQEEKDRQIAAEREAKEREIAAQADAKRQELLDQAAEAPRGFGAPAANEELELSLAAIDEEEKSARMGVITQASAASFDAGRKTVKGLRELVNDFEVLDLSKIPDNLVIKTPNKQAILALLRAGQEVPGVRKIVKASISFGANTYVPREAVAQERAARIQATPSVAARHGRRQPAAAETSSRRTSGGRDRNRASGRR